MQKPVYLLIYEAFQVSQTFKNTGNSGYLAVWESKVEDLIEEYLPTGSGFDSEVRLDWGRSNLTQLVFRTQFHHMTMYGQYYGWTDHLVYVTPSFYKISVRVTGRDRNNIKDHIAEHFYNALTRTVEVNDE